MPLRSGTPLPSLDGATEWLNGEVTREQLIGKPVLVAFWAVSCHICKDNMPTLTQWKQEFPQVSFVSVHMPRQESDLDLNVVKSAVARFEVQEPVAIDGEHEIGERFETGGLWPYYLLFDAGGNLKSRSAGAVGLKAIEGTLRRLLEAPTTVAS